ncbi:MAG: group I intron-associated PD-(D/E)XK endonuclease [Chloroflexota bacterium]
MSDLRHSTKDKGDLALIKVIADLRQHGILCCLPLSEHLPFDLVAVMPDMKTLIRVQVKYRSAVKSGFVKVEFRSNYYDSQKIYSKPVDFTEIDAYAIYIPDVDEVCYFRVDALHKDASTLTLRFEPPKNNQRKGVNLVEDFADPRLIARQLRIHSVNLACRQRTMQDELALSRFIVYLQEHNQYPLLSNSMYTPFDLITVESDMQTMTRYSVFNESMRPQIHVDKLVQFTEDMEIPLILENRAIK